jgi:hypothetical protein
MILPIAEVIMKWVLLVRRRVLATKRHGIIFAIVRIVFERSWDGGPRFVQSSIETLTMDS